MKTLVTGANGLLGSNLVRELLKRGHEVRALVREGSDLRTLQGLPLELFYADLLDESSLINACRGCTYVIHAAGKTAGRQVKFEDFSPINIKGTQNIVRAAEMAGVSRMVHVSSCCVFSGGSREHPSTELSEFTGFRFNSGYINSKYLAQHWVLSEVERKGFPVVIVNPTILIGPYDLRPTSGETVLRILRQQIQLCPKGVKNFIDVRDAASAICNALTAGTPGECYLLGSENLSFFELFGKVNRISGRPGVRISVPGTILRGAGLIGNAIRSLTGNEVPLNFCHSRQLALESYFSSEKAVRVLGLRQNPIDNAIRDAIAWFYDNGYLDEILTELPVLQQAA